MTEVIEDSVEASEILERLAEIRPLIEAHEADLDRFYAERLGLYQRGQRTDPRLTQHRMAVAAGVTDVAVSVALSKATKRAKEAGNG